ncbi:MAG: tetratricopeptide repeat protein, partial [Acidobacteriota bacterium]
GAETLYRETISRWPNDVVAHSGLAEVLKAKDDLTGAETLYRETISRWPDNVVAHNGLANVLRKQRRFAEALDLLPEPATLLSRQDLINLHLHGMILLDSGDVERAIRAFERGLAAGSGSRQEVYYRSALIVAHLRQQHYREVLQELEALPESQPTLGALRLHALAGDSQEQQACELHNNLSAKILNFRRPVRITLQRIEEAYGLTSAAGLRQPTQSQLEDVISAEIEMLVAA